MPQDEPADKIIKFGDTLTGSDSEVHILGYDVEADAFLCDVFTLDGKLIGHALPIRATIIETCFRKRG
jgi:hypothetical protein